MALPEPTSKGIQEAEAVDRRADWYRTARRLIAEADLIAEAEPEDVLRLARYLVGEES